MPIVQPAFVVARVGQDVSETVTVPGNTAGFNPVAVLRDQLGPYGTVIATKTLGNGIVNNASGNDNVNSTIVITWAAADLAGLAPGPYVWSLFNDAAGDVFDLVDWSTFLLTPADDSEYPQLTNLSELLAHLGDSETVSDADAKARLQLIASAERAVRDLCGRQFNYATYTDYPDTDWRRLAMVNEYPVNPADIDVRFDRSRLFDVTTKLTYGTDFTLDHMDSMTGWSKSGILVRLTGTWPGDWDRTVPNIEPRPVPAKGMLKVVYAAGFPLIPHDLKLAVWEIVADRLSARRKGVPLQSESGMNYSYSRAAWADEAAKVLAVQNIIPNYRRGDVYVGGGGV